jgi:hypothetical protein
MMRVKMTICVGLAAVAVTWARPVRAQTIEERIKILEDKIAERGEAASHEVGIDMHALVMTDFNWDFNSPPGDIPLSTFNFKSNTFTLRDAAIFLGRNKDDESFGFNINVDFGDTAKAIQARWANSTTPVPDSPYSTRTGKNLCGNDLGDNCFVELREAYLTYKTPLTMPTSGAPISIKAGKFITLLGYEVIPTYTNFNPNISTSFLFGFSVPFTHTGLLAHLPIIDEVAADVGVVNGWDNVDDNNNSQSLLAGVGITPIKPLVFYISGTFGAENDATKFVNSAGVPGSGGGSNRGVLSANGTWAVTDQLSFVLDGTWANESNSTRGADYATKGKMQVNWWGLAGYVIVQPMEKMQVALRSEWFGDPDGAQTGVDQTLWELTPTFTYGLTDHLTFRTEYRHDESDKRFFTTGSGAQVRGQDLVFTELIAAF